MEMNDQKCTPVLYFREIFFSVILLVFSFSGIVYSAEHASPGNTAVAPAFAFPCSSNGTCQELDVCADADFGRCKGFKGVSGLRRVLSGSFGTLGFRAQTVNIKSGKPVSLWHDFPLVVSDNENGLVGSALTERLKNLTGSQDVCDDCHTRSLQEGGK
jgi:hypothetical protein